MVKFSEKGKQIISRDDFCKSFSGCPAKEWFGLMSPDNVNNLRMKIISRSSADSTPFYQKKRHRFVDVIYVKGQTPDKIHQRLQYHFTYFKIGDQYVLETDNE